MESKLKYKFFWNWDHSTNWCLNTRGRQNCGVANTYTKPADEFVADYKRMIDWAAANGISAVGCVGLLRDSHGGLDNARRICTYAKERGVRLNLIAGLYSYGGLYYEGNSKMSLDKFLEANPDCMARDIDGSPRFIRFSPLIGGKKEPMACPSNPKVRNFVLDTLSFLFLTLPDLGGIQMETGDCPPVCMCDKCRERRRSYQEGEKHVQEISIADMADIYPEAAEAVWSTRPDAWVVCELYTHFVVHTIFQDAGSPTMKALCKLPEKAFLQWGDRHFHGKEWTEDQVLPAHLRKYHNIMRYHHSTQWEGGRHTLAIDNIRKQCKISAATGYDCVSMFGECSPFHANTEFNYLALQYFADRPTAPLSAFIGDVMAPRLGCSNDVAAKFVEFAGYTATPEKVPAAIEDITAILTGIKDYDAKRRWIYLASFLNAYHWEAEQNKLQPSHN